MKRDEVILYSKGKRTLIAAFGKQLFIPFGVHYSNWMHLWESAMSCFIIAEAAEEKVQIGGTVQKFGFTIQVCYPDSEL